MPDFVVEPDEDGERLDVVVGGRVGSRAAAQRLIEGGAVRVDGSSRPKRHLVRAGQTVRVDELGSQEEAPPPPISFRKVYEDEHLLVVDKPAGVIVHPGTGRRSGTLVQALEDRIGGGDDPVRPGVVHRLDRDTSGLIVLARTDEAFAGLKRLMGSRQAEREYLALVEGRPPARRGTIDAPIGRDRRVRTRMSTDSDDPRPAVTHFVIERALPDATLLRVRLETGRTHQIRVHMKAIGHPVCGDPEYGTAGRFGLQRQFLHACRLAFDHPLSGDRVELTSELPEDLAAALRSADAPTGSGT